MFHADFSVIFECFPRYEYPDTLGCQKAKDTQLGSRKFSQSAKPFNIFILTKRPRTSQERWSLKF